MSMIIQKVVSELYEDTEDLHEGQHLKANGIDLYHGVFTKNL